MYTAHFNLTGEPFALTPDPFFLYLSPGHSEALAGLKIGLRHRRGLMVMTGEVGTGKTTLLYSLLSEPRPEIYTAYISNTRLSFEDILRQTLAEYNVPGGGQDKLSLLTALNRFLLRCADEDRTATLVIDEAQNLDDEAFENLRLLSNFETFSTKLLQIVLVGQPELTLKLRKRNLRQLAERIAVRCDLGPLTPTESRKYIEHRLECVGGAPDLFTAGALRVIVRHCRGIPRRINIVCHEALLLAYARGAKRVTQEIAKAAAGQRIGAVPLREQLRRVWARPAPFPLQTATVNRLVTAAAAVVAVVGLTTVVRWHQVPRQPAVRAPQALPAGPIVSSAVLHKIEVPPTPQLTPVPPEPRAQDQPVAAAGETSAVSSAGDQPQPAPAPPAPAPQAADAADSQAFCADTGSPASDSTEDQDGTADTASDTRTTAGDPDQHPYFRLVRVQRGATLMSLTRQMYGDANDQLLNLVQLFNPQIVNFNRIQAGDTLRFPQIDTVPRGDAG